MKAMTETAADWVYDVVLTQRYKESTGAIMWTGARENRRDGGQGAPFLRMCACRYGPCGHCAGGVHEKCTHRRHEPSVSPDTYMQNPRGHALAAVWMSGRPCTWRCSCDCPPIEPKPGQTELFAVDRSWKRYGQPGFGRRDAAVPDGQLELFALAGGAR